MSKYSDEMISNLANLLNKHSVGLDKTAAKKEKDEEVKEDKEEAKEEKKEKPKGKAKGKGKKKKAYMSEVLNNLVKLAEELDAAGSKEAADLVDDALQVIVKNIKEEE